MSALRPASTGRGDLPQRGGADCTTPSSARFARRHRRRSTCRPGHGGRDPAPCRVDDGAAWWRAAATASCAPAGLAAEHDGVLATSADRGRLHVISAFRDDSQPRRLRAGRAEARDPVEPKPLTATRSTTGEREFDAGQPLGEHDRLGGRTPSWPATPPPCPYRPQRGVRRRRRPRHGPGWSRSGTPGLRAGYDHADAVLDDGCSTCAWSDAVASRLLAHVPEGVRRHPQCHPEVTMCAGACRSVPDARERPVPSGSGSVLPRLEAPGVLRRHPTDHLM